MSLTELRATERAALCTTLTGLGPDAPTLCSRWTTADLAAHLVVSEKAWGLPMVVAYQARRALPAALVLRSMRSLQAVGDRQIEKAKGRGWDWLLHRLSAGPPLPYRLRSVAPIRLIEEWIHHEDVRRANGLPPRSSSVQLDEALWQAGLRLTRFREFLPGREGLEIVLPDGRTHRLGATTRVRLEGSPGELLLFLAGRTTVANVTIDGDHDAIRALDGSLAV